MSRDFDGSDDNILVTMPNVTTVMALAAWVMFDTLPATSTSAHVLSKTDAGSGSRNYSFDYRFYTPNRRLEFNYTTGPSVFVERYVEVALNAAQWYHLCWVVDFTNDVYALYLD